ncbi:MAG TPA: 4-hydroxy-tetrahydrodipicolinate reductase, partial [Porticoccaceae bacterium]|nr:4-hydroxy-tetrahydrodipicolinate reductase [Porticoccaceae bacterium]
MKNIAITGAGGRMGKALIEAIASTDGIQLTVAIEHSGSSLTGTDAGEIAGLGRNNIAVVSSLDELADSFDTLIDFSVPVATVENAEFCRRHGKKMVVGTTGLTTDQVQAVQHASEYTSICMASNFATGVNLCFKLAELAASVLGNDVDIEISEAHHRHKVDAPSGTALSLGEAVAGALGRDLNEVAVYDRQG